MTISLSHTGAAAQIYYRGGSSAPLSRLISRVLGPGMRFLDVGAHVGEYSLLAARLIGPEGRVDAVEPQEALTPLIEENARRNRLGNILVHPVALGARDAQGQLRADQKSGGAWLTGGMGGESVTPVEVLSLDSFLRKTGSQPIDLAKIDAAGNEAAVIRGGERTLRGSGLPRLVYKLYSPRVVSERVGLPVDAFELLLDYGYRQWVVLDELTEVTSQSAVHRVLPVDWYSVPVFATKESQGPDYRSSTQ